MPCPRSSRCSSSHLPCWVRAGEYTESVTHSQCDARPTFICSQLTLVLIAPIDEHGNMPRPSPIAALSGFHVEKLRRATVPRYGCATAATPPPRQRRLCFRLRPGSLRALHPAAADHNRRFWPSLFKRLRCRWWEIFILPTCGKHKPNQGKDNYNRESC